jgi:lantibiotic modifying enzyme
MGKRRRKLLRKKFSKLSWNKYYENLAKNNEQPQEQTMIKVVEDNSVILERMKSMSSSCDKILQAIDSINTEDSTQNIAAVEPQFKSLEPPPELEEEKAPIPDLTKLLKKELLNIAKEKGCDVKPSMTKANIIKAIEAS